MEAMHYKLIKTLHTKGLLAKSLEDFMLQTNKFQKIQFSENLLRTHDLLPNYDEFKMEKCDKKAEEFRELGNQLFIKDKNFYEALVNYNKSLCYSTEGSENVGTAFANRSAVYFQMGQYEKCLENIKLAKNHNYPKEKIEKLNIREEAALLKLNNGPDPSQKLIKYENARERFLKPKLKAKENLNFYVADCLEVKTDPQFGRHLITNRDLRVGAVIVVEKPFSKVLDKSAIHERCANCMEKKFLNLLPCLKCSSAMFCSEACRSAGEEKFHKYECGLMNVIWQIFSSNSLSYHLALRNYFEALHIFGSPSKLREFLESVKDSEETILDFKYKDEAEFLKNSLQSIDSLLTNEESEYLNHKNLFQYGNFCAILCDLMLNQSEALKTVLMDEADKEFFREFVFKYMLIGIGNSHSMYGMKSDIIDEESKIGAGNYPFCALINHSCASNVFRKFFKNQIWLVVRRPIKAGEQIFDDYGYRHIDQDKNTRQEDLLRQYCFECQCEACQKDYPLRYDLKYKRRNLYKTLNNLEETFQKPNLEVAVKNFETLCKIIDKLDGTDYPSMELTDLQACFLSCLRIFSNNEIY